MSVYSSRLSQWAHAVSLANIPANVTADINLRILDIIGVSLAASSMPTGDVIRRAVRNMGSGAGGCVLGFGDTSSPMLAALANGTLAHCRDSDDTHNESVSHISAPGVATTPSLGGADNSTGADHLMACVYGNENRPG